MVRRDSALRRQVVDLLLLALREPRAVTRLGRRDLDLLIRLARRSRLHGRLGSELAQAGLLEQLPQSARDQLESAFAMAKARERVANWELDRIEWAVDIESEVPIVCLKGAAYMLLELPNVPGRIFADVDFLVPEADLRRVEQALNRAGWHTQELTPYDDNYYRRWTHELPPLMHMERDVEIDLHHNILPRTARLKPSSEKMIAASYRIAGTRYSVPCDADVALHAMTHLMFDSDLADKLRDLVDIDDLMTHFSGNDPMFWDRLLERAEELDLKRPTYYALRYAAKILQSNVPQSVLQRSADWAPVAPIRWLMDRLAPRALLPPHPDQSTRSIGVARLLLYMRSHWLRMPPWLLAYHLSVKFVRKRLGGLPPSG
jgi:hypothetical protein